MAPIVYPVNIAFKATGTGPLPGYSGTLQWADLNSLLATAKESISVAYLAYLNADMAGDTGAKEAAITTMNNTLASFAAAVVTLEYFAEVRILLLNNGGVIRASSNPADMGKREMGRIEEIVAQQNIDTIANGVRTSSTTDKFTWYGALSMGSFSPASEFPAHILKFAGNM